MRQFLPKLAGTVYGFSEVLANQFAPPAGEARLGFSVLDAAARLERGEMKKGAKPLKINKP
jgi:hypothetical protein